VVGPYPQAGFDNMASTVPAATPTGPIVKPTQSTHAFNGIGDQNQVNPLFARRGSRPISR
jgi:hypothetical protein